MCNKLRSALCNAYFKTNQLNIIINFLSSLVSELPALDGEIKKITHDLVALQDLFSEVELGKIKHFVWKQEG